MLPHSWARLINNRALESFPSRQEIDKSLKSKKLQISSIFATLRLLYRVIDMPIFIFRFSCLISECHQLVNKDMFTLVMMMMKKSRWFQSRNVLRIAVTKSNSATEDKQNSSGLLFRFSEKWEMRHLQYVHDVSSIPWHTHKVKSCSILLIPWFGEMRVWSGETHSETAERQQKIAYQMCFSEMWTDGYQIKVLVNVCLSVFL